MLAQAALVALSMIGMTLAASTPTGTAGAADAVQTMWGQCGGQGFTGPTTCVEGAVCVKHNQYYCQCLPGTTATATATATV